MKRITKNFITLCLVLCFALFLTLPVLAQTQDIDNLKNSLNTSAGTAGLDTKTDLQTAIGRPIGYLFGVIGVIFLAVTLLGGFIWMTAGGNEEKVHKAKQFIGNGVNGLIVMFFAYALVYVVLAALSNAAG